MNSTGTPRAVAFSRAASLLASGLVILLALFELLVWSVRAYYAADAVPGLVVMKISTAVVFLLAGTALALSQTDSQRPAPRWRRAAAIFCALLVTGLGLLGLVDFVFGWGIDLDQVLLQELTRQGSRLAGTESAPITALCFVFAGLALVLLDVRIGRIRPTEPLVIAVLGVSLLVLVAYLYGVALVSDVTSHVQMALHTAVALLTLAAGILLARPTDGLMAIVTSGHEGGSLARRLLPAVVGLPLVLGWLRLEGQRLGLYGTALGLSLVVVASALILAWLTLIVAHRFNRNEIRRKAAERVVRMSEERLRMVVTGTPVILFALDRDGIFTLSEGKGLDALGRDPGETVGQSIYDVYRDEPLILDNVRRALRGETVSSLVEVADLIFDARYSPMHDEQGEIVGVMGVALDVTQRKRAEEELERTAAELARSNAELEQFAYVASHDLQEPLRMVASYMQLLARRYRGQLDADADDFIHFAVDGATRMQALINDLLAYSRAGTSKRPLEPTDCTAVVGNVLKNLQVALEETQGTVKFDSLPEVLGDRSQLEQLFQNLLSNALKFRGSEPPRVKISAELIDGEWQFAIRDNGIGMDPKYRERIFLIFQRLHNRQTYSGTGIGLAVCKKIVERHGGQIWVESQPGQGSIFYFTLPAVGVESHESGNADAADRDLVGRR